jgi:hypothetical protein
MTPANQKSKLLLSNQSEIRRKIKRLIIISQKRNDVSQSEVKTAIAQPTNNKEKNYMLNNHKVEEK